MSKRRTKKQKEGAKHAFTISWSPKKFSQSEARKERLEPDVKGQFGMDTKSQKLQNTKIVLPENTEKQDNSASIRKDITKSLILAGLILASEIVLYLFLS